MNCCSKKKMINNNVSNRSTPISQTTVNQEYFDFVEACGNIADESTKNTNAIGLRKLHANVNRFSVFEEAPPFMEKYFNVVEETYQALQTSNTVGIWKTYCPADFQMVKINIARGSTCKIHLVMHKKSGFIGVLKVMPPNKMAEARTELNVLTMARENPFIIRLMDGFLCENYYLFLEYAPFRTIDHLTQAVRGLGSDGSRLYALEVICALQFLHERRIIHRDVKPENVLILLSGHVALSDLGSSIMLEGNTILNRPCGTYVTRPPEVWNKQSYSTPVDIWELGMSLFNMIANSWPIVHPNKEKQIALVTNGKIVFTEVFKEQATDIISQMLQVDPSKRPTCTELLRHEYFESLREPYAPPYTPSQLFSIFDYGDEGRVIQELISKIEKKSSF
ncbi:uncharacterized protein LOC131937465 [Physella acuta]|uniref:uncharacterized protein LOC131937465 n=1 Tax=Physella acuta TaxID=109671 RepID=UPI0027DC070C|nr:uncharacterized protein LOC131937465 [Physella acuta]